MAVIMFCSWEKCLQCLNKQATLGKGDKMPCCGFNFLWTCICFSGICNELFPLGWVGCPSSTGHFQGCTDRSGNQIARVLNVELGSLGLSRPGVIALCYLGKTCSTSLYARAYSIHVHVGKWDTVLANTIHTVYI